MEYDFDIVNNNELSMQICSYSKLIMN